MLEGASSLTVRNYVRSMCCKFGQPVTAAYSKSKSQSRAMRETSCSSDPGSVMPNTHDVCPNSNATTLAGGLKRSLGFRTL